MTTGKGSKNGANDLDTEHPARLTGDTAYQKSCNEIDQRFIVRDFVI